MTSILSFAYIRSSTKPTIQPPVHTYLESKEPSLYTISTLTNFPSPASPDSHDYVQLNTHQVGWGLSIYWPLYATPLPMTVLTSIISLLSLSIHIRSPISCSASSIPLFDSALRFRSLIPFSHRPFPDHPTLCFFNDDEDNPLPLRRSIHSH
jgi:hypothetical protein